jgi:hypothetical protein
MGWLLHIADAHAGALRWRSIPVVFFPPGHPSSTPVCAVRFPPQYFPLVWQVTRLLPPCVLSLSHQAPATQNG